MCICPNLESLSVKIWSDIYDPRLEVPPENFLQGFNPFTTLRTYLISSASPFSIPNIISCIRSARAQSSHRRIPLTHFKIEVNGGIQKDLIFDLLDALDVCSLKTLVLDGIRYAQPDLIDKIAQTFPNLFDLVLIYRACDIQFQPGFIEWPCAAWEYASHFSSFKNLHYLGWNCRRAEPTITIASMPCFENDDFTIPMYDVDIPLDDERLLAKCLWSYCPSLEYMLITADIPALAFRRTIKDGLVQFENFTVMNLGAFGRNPSTGICWTPYFPRT
ncbi:hypothetical protein QCA50_005572 [Cerrena zonata]|uniref:Uncharacterized protein n=1 Tax=Cerrena zonata TaxID=2478898 RepID=A0AAW0GLG6_9APHY